MGLDGVRLNQGQGGDLVGVDSINGVDYQVVKLAHGSEGSVSLVDASHPLPVTDVSAEASLDAIEAAVTGTLTTKVAGAATPTPTTVAASATSVQLLASNTSARQRIIVNDSTATLYVKYGATATASAGGYTYVLPPKQETSMSVLVLAGNELYTGVIHGIWSSATGSASITEVA